MTFKIPNVILTAIMFFIVPTLSEAAITIGGINVTTSNLDYLTYRRHWRILEENQNGAVWESGNPENLIGKTDAEIQAIVNNHAALETNLWLTELDDRMMADTEVFTFATMDQIKQEFLLRARVVLIMDHFNLYKHFWYGSAPYTTSAASWGYYGDGSRYWMYQKEGNTASDAIIEIVSTNTQTEGECYTATVICIWYGQCYSLGTQAFNAKWPSTDSPSRMDTWLAISSPPYRSKLTRDVDSGAGHLHVIGDWIYLKNYNYVDVIKDPFLRGKYLDPGKQYPWSGENAVYTGHGNGLDTYTGLGLSRMSESAMRDKLRNAYNKDFAKIFNAPDGKLDTNGDGIGDLKIRELEDNGVDNAKIEWVRQQRVHN